MKANMSDDGCGHHRCVGRAAGGGICRAGRCSVAFGLGLGGMALANLVNPADVLAADLQPAPAPGLGTDRGVLGGQLHVPAKAKRVIYLFMAGGPSQMETFDYKPVLRRSATASSCPIRCARGSGSPACPAISRRCRSPGRSSGSRSTARNGTWVSATCCRTPPKIVDELCIVRSMFTEAINHDPAITFFQSGSQIAGRPSMGAWIHYGLGSDNDDLPAFVVLITPGKVDQPLYSRLWGSGFLPSQHQGVQFRSGKDAGAVSGQSRRRRAREPAAAARSAARSARARGRAARRHRGRRAASRSTRWPIACRRACPA